MKRILWIFCAFMPIFIFGCASSPKAIKLPRWRPVPQIRNSTVLIRYNVGQCYARGTGEDVAIIAPIIERGLRHRGAIVVVEGVRDRWPRKRWALPDFEALVCASRIRDKSNVFGNLYLYKGRAMIVVRVIDQAGRVIAASVGEHEFRGDSGIYAGAWLSSFRVAAHIASRLLSGK
ncbi:MAG: hypothetical protein HYY55_02935 [Candidatus Niyogibacteria bacterium]|nr:MAG: hypothetical protein HYY55_02935 [Candidatus Niyogibacteria bacterium]